MPRAVSVRRSKSLPKSQPLAGKKGKVYSLNRARVRRNAALDALDDGFDGFGRVRDPDFEAFGWAMADYADLLPET